MVHAARKQKNSGQSQEQLMNNQDPHSALPMYFMAACLLFAIVMSLLKFVF